MCCVLAHYAIAAILVQVLDNLVDEQNIPPEKADQAKSWFSKLHAALISAMSREKELLDEAKQLKRQLDVSVHLQCRVCIHMHPPHATHNTACTRTRMFSRGLHSQVCC